MEAAVLDTDMLSEILKGRDANVVAKARQYHAEHGQFVFSAMTYYEVLRGIQLRKATRQIARFPQFASAAGVVPISIPILERASDLWAMAVNGGHPNGDADLIIAATSLEVGRVLVTGNTAHFAWIPGLKLEDWR
jgi:tRNA(fMet)-specific endonuclease VapC